MTEYLHCAACKRIEWEVSEEDPDATLSDAGNHLMRAHPGAGLSNIKEGPRPR